FATLPRTWGQRTFGSTRSRLVRFAPSRRGVSRVSRRWKSTSARSRRCGVTPRPTRSATSPYFWRVTSRGTSPVSSSFAIRATTSWGCSLPSPQLQVQQNRAREEKEPTDHAEGIERLRTAEATTEHEILESDDSVRHRQHVRDPRSRRLKRLQRQKESTEEDRRQQHEHGELHRVFLRRRDEGEGQADAQGGKDQQRYDLGEDDRVTPQWHAQSLDQQRGQRGADH